MFRVKVAALAEKDIRGAVNYIAQELQNPAAAQRLLRNFRHAVLSLSEMPLRHGLVDDAVLEIQGIRSLPVDNYLLFYIVNEDEKTVEVARFIYSKSGRSKQLLEGDLDA